MDEMHEGHLTTPAWHGTPGGYTNHGCRCLACTSANTKKVRKYRQGRKAARIDKALEVFGSFDGPTTPEQLKEVVAILLGEADQTLERPRPRPASRATKIDPAVIVPMILQGMTDRQIGKEVGVSATGVYYARLRLGYPVATKMEPSDEAAIRG